MSHIMWLLCLVDQLCVNSISHTLTIQFILYLHSTLLQMAYSFVQPNNQKLTNIQKTWSQVEYK